MGGNNGLRSGTKYVGCFDESGIRVRDDGRLDGPGDAFDMFLGSI